MTIRIARTRPEQAGYCEVKVTATMAGSPIVYIYDPPHGPRVLPVGPSLAVKTADIAHALRKFESATVYVPPEITLCE